MYDKVTQTTLAKRIEYNYLRTTRICTHANIKRFTLLIKFIGTKIRPCTSLKAKTKCTAIYLMYYNI